MLNNRCLTISWEGFHFGIPQFQLVETFYKIRSIVSVRRLELLDGKATTLFAARVPERVIRSCTGHSSLDV